MPRDVPQANYLECKAYGANVTLVDGLISDCGRMVAERGPQEGWFDVSTLKEPYRIEGKKTMGYEVAEQMDWELPDAIFYPTGGGVGMIGMWKAFDEMEQLGWIGSRRPEDDRGAGGGLRSRWCAPSRKTSRAAASSRTPTRWPPACACPSRWAIFWCCEAVRASGGTAIAVSDDEMLDAGVELASDEGIYAAPEGAACVAALRKLLANGFLKPSRPHRALQHRLRPEVPGSLFHALSADRGQRAGQAGRTDHAAMKDLALERWTRWRGAASPTPTCAPWRSREREITTKNGKAGHVSSGESAGIGIRVLAVGLLGIRRHRRPYARGRGSRRRAGAARSRAAGTAARKARCRRWRPKRSTRPPGFRPAASIRSPIPVDRNLAVLLAVDAELRRNPGVTLAEASMHFERRRQVFASTLGSLIDQTRYTSGAGFSALSYKDGEIQKRSYPNSFGGQYQLKGYELVDELRPAGKTPPRIAEEAVALHSRRPVPGRRVRPDSGQLATGLADSRIHRPSHRARPRAGQRGQLRRHELPDAGSAGPAALRLGHRERGVRRAPGARARPGHVRLRRRRRAGAVHRHHSRRAFSWVT